MQKRNKNLLKNTFILGFGTFCTKGLLFIMTPFFIRWLSQENYGMFDLIITYIALGIPLVTGEIAQASFRFLLKENEDYNEIIGNSLFISLIGSFISLLIVLIISLFYSSFFNILVPVVLCVFFEIFYNTFVMILRGLKKLGQYSIANIFYSFSMAFFVFLFVRVFQLGLFGMILSYALGYFVCDIYMLFYLKKIKVFDHIILNRLKLKQMLKYSLPLIPCDVSWWIMNVSDRTIVSYFLGFSSNAILSIANKIPNICQNLFSVFHLSWQESAILSLKDDDREIYYSDIMNQMLVILCTISSVILSCNFLFFDFIFTPDYFEGYYHVPILILSIILSMLAQFYGSIYIANMNSKKSGLTTSYAAIINIIVHLLLIKFIGLYAASISTFTSYLLLFLIRYIDINKHFVLRFNRKSVICMFILLYFVLVVYINNIYLNIFNLILSFLIFFGFNKSNIFRILKRGD